MIKLRLSSHTVLCITHAMLFVNAHVRYILENYISSHYVLENQA